MSTKHDALTEDDMRRFSMNPALLGQLRSHACARGPAPLRILDWGCGRGRSVALLRQEGFEAFGLDIDRAVLHNGHDLFRARGLDPERLLRHIDDIGTFSDGGFDVVFSEETLEHVADLAQLARESFRLLRPGGIAIHSFPGSRWLIEPHIHMPLVHWLPAGHLRRWSMLLCLACGLGPRPPWPETANADLSRQLGVYYRYLEEKTHYRSRNVVMATFAAAGFVGRWRDARAAGWRRLLPSGLSDNGFPAGHLLLKLTKPT